METDIGTIEPSRVDFQGLRPEMAHELEPEPEHEPRVEQVRHQEWDPVQYYPIPQSYQQPEKRDILADMDRTTYIFLFIAFIVGFFIGRGMIQPVVLKGS